MCGSKPTLTHFNCFVYPSQATPLSLQFWHCGRFSSHLMRIVRHVRQPGASSAHTVRERLRAFRTDLCVIDGNKAAALPSPLSSPSCLFHRSWPGCWGRQLNLLLGRCRWISMDLYAGSRCYVPLTGIFPAPTPRYQDWGSMGASMSLIRGSYSSYVVVSIYNVEVATSAHFGPDQSSRTSSAGLIAHELMAPLLLSSRLGFRISCPNSGRSGGTQSSPLLAPIPPSHV